MSEDVKSETKVESRIDVVNGAMVPKDHGELNRTLVTIAAGGGFPDRFDTPQKRIAAYNLGHALMGSKWQLALNHIAPIKGQLTIYGELPGALAEQTGEVQEKEVYALDEDYNKICLENKNIDWPAHAGVCVIQRKGRAKKEFTYTLKEAEGAGQYPAKRRDGSINNDSPWMKFTKVMLMRKAMAMAIKFEFPDALLGVPVAEYEYDEAPDLAPVKDVTPPGSDEEIASARDLIMQTRANHIDKTSGQESLADVELSQKEATNG